jgi:hypothetical protein
VCVCVCVFLGLDFSVYILSQSTSFFFFFVKGFFKLWFSKLFAQADIQLQSYWVPRIIGMSHRWQVKGFLSRLFFPLSNWKSFQNMCQQMFLSFMTINGFLNHLSWVWQNSFENSFILILEEAFVIIINFFS